MKVDKDATKEARRRHIEGLARLMEFFNVNPGYVDLATPQDQRWLSRSKAIRRIYRRARMRADPNWSARRAKRKRQRRARKASR